MPILDTLRNALPFNSFSSEKNYFDVLKEITLTFPDRKKIMFIKKKQKKQKNKKSILFLLNRK